MIRLKRVYEEPSKGDGLRILVERLWPRGFKKEQVAVDLWLKDVAAKAVAKVLHPHFVKEEEYALPPLGLLSLLAEGKVLPEMENVLTMTDRLKAEHHQMLKEYKAIVAALKNLSAIAKKEKKVEYAHFAEKLILHAQTEEEVLYPTTILIGEYLKLKLAR